MVGAVALVAALGYVLTPLSASGPEGQPVGFRLNLRYLTPALVLGLVVLPMLPALQGERRRGALLVALSAVLVITDKPFEFLESDLATGAVAIALVAVVAPAILVGFRRRGLPAPALALGLAALVAMGVALGYSEQRDYARGRYLSSYPSIYPRQILEAGLGDTFRWANNTRDSDIALAGTTGALFQYGLYGPDASNRVQFIGQKGPHGSFAPLLDCSSWRRALNEGGYDYLVTTPILNQRDETSEIPSPEASWARREPNAEKILNRGRYRVFELTGPLAPAKCPTNARRFPLHAFFR
jgi:hypothetical protein